jgi:hypothetical protein
MRPHIQFAVDRSEAMSSAVIITLSVHALAAVYWAGSTFVLARDPQLSAIDLFRPQMGAAVIAVLTGAYLWHLLHEGGFGSVERVLAVGALCAIAAAGAQGALVGGARRRLAKGEINDSEAVRRIALGERIAAVLLAAALICMVSARYF